MSTGIQYWLGNKKDYEVSVYRFGFTRITDRTSRISEVDND